MPMRTLYEEVVPTAVKTRLVWLVMVQSMNFEVIEDVRVLFVACIGSHNRNIWTCPETGPKVHYSVKRHPLLFRWRRVSD